MERAKVHYEVFVRKTPAAGWTLGIATGKNRRGLDAVLGSHGLHPRFATLQTADSAPGKPNPTMIFQAMEEAGFGPENTVMIGDTVFDMAMARNAKVRGLGVSWGYHADDELIEHGAERVLANFAELLPAKSGFRLDVEIDFDTSVIGRQRKVFDLEAAAYSKEISRARTFGFMRDVEQLWKAGFALGASLDNTVAVGDDKVINPEGLRYGDEFVRHKVLDAIGDLALAGYPIIGEFRSYCGGHRMNVRILEALFADRANYAIVEAEPVYAAPRAVQMAAAAPAAFAPDVH